TGRGLRWGQRPPRDLRLSSQTSMITRWPSACSSTPPSRSRLTTGVWTLGEALGHTGPHRLQHLLSRAKWDERQVLDQTAVWAAGHLTGDDPHAGQDAVFILDETGDAKSSTDCVGAARQYSGSLGGVALCQVTVNLTYVTARGHTIIDRRLYLPRDWASDEERRELAGVPEQVEFATNPQLAAQMLTRAHDRAIRAPFAAGDEVYGGRDLRRH